MWMGSYTNMISQDGTAAYPLRCNNWNLQERSWIWYKDWDLRLDCSVTREWWCQTLYHLSILVWRRKKCSAKEVRTLLDFQLAYLKAMKYPKELTTLFCCSSLSVCEVVRMWYEAWEFGNRSAWSVYRGWCIKHYPLFTKFLHTVKRHKRGLCTSEYCQDGKHSLLIVYMCVAWLLEQARVDTTWSHSLVTFTDHIRWEKKRKAFVCKCVYMHIQCSTWVTCTKTKHRDQRSGMLFWLFRLWCT